MNSLSKPRIQRITSKGQITLPISWRRKVQTEMIMIRETSNGIHISPARTLKLDPEDRNDDIIIFNADRDNGGKGIEASVLADMLRRSITKDKKSKRGS
jgi:bifunctional DNA-binding transcriptional regulator/antitoxin component of YhaV-PrlF toxin-antitoxin module